MRSKYNCPRNCENAVALLDTSHHDNQIIPRDKMGRGKDSHDIFLERQGRSKTVGFTIEVATDYMDDRRSYTIEEDADAGLQINLKDSLLVSLSSPLIQQREDSQNCNKRRLHMGFNCEDLAWLVFIKQFHCFISLLFVISVLSTFPNIDNRKYIFVKVYFFHLVRPPCTDRKSVV